ncbi:MAG: restriction endonuclease [Chloroflexota bacterium]|jgi:restriction system protein|nr:restriction endonuclease [Chloroflexota bacterium]
MGWGVWAFFLAFITWQGKKPILLFDSLLSYLLFAFLGVITGGITLGNLFYRLRQNWIRLKDAQTIEDLLAITPEQFEDLVAKLFRVYGHDVEKVGGTSDHGVDILVLSDRGEKWVVQCKRYSGSVGEPIVRDLFGTMLHEGAQRAYLITTGGITKQAVEWAEGKPIILYDGEGLVKLIRRAKKKSS